MGVTTTGVPISELEHHDDLLTVKVLGRMDVACNKLVDGNTDRLHHLVMLADVVDFVVPIACISVPGAVYHVDSLDLAEASGDDGVDVGVYSEHVMLDPVISVVEVVHGSTVVAIFGRINRIEIWSIEHLSGVVLIDSTVDVVVFSIVRVFHEENFRDCVYHCEHQSVGYLITT